jgi:hypothetical protein
VPAHIPAEVREPQLADTVQGLQSKVDTIDRIGTRAGSPPRDG